MRRTHALLLLTILALPGLGCAHRGPAPIEVPAAPVQVRTLDDFEVALNRYVLLPIDHESRAASRAELSSFLLTHMDRAIDRDDPDEAEISLRFAIALYTAAELRTAGADPRLADAAHRLYRLTARRGSELPSLLALAVQQRFGDEAMRQEAVADWEVLERWLVDNGPFSEEPLLAHEDLEQALEMVAAYFPSPFLVQRLADLYVARYDAAVRAHSRGGGLGNTTQRRVEITGYLLMRLYLRADDPDGAIAAMSRVGSRAGSRVGNDDAVDKLALILRDAFDEKRSPRPLLSLAEQFIPEPDTDPSLPHVTQSWAIIDNIVRRALERYPDDPYVHLMRAQVLRQAGLDGAALHHLRQSVELKDDVFDTWQALAELEQSELSELARRDPDGALARLPELETLHHRAVKLWRDRPIHPALPEAYFTVAEGLYQAGRIDDAQQLLDKSLAIEARPETLDLLGTIASKRARYGVAASHYEQLLRLPSDMDETKLRWEAHARGQLGEIALRRGDTKAAAEHLRTALRQTNELLTRPALGARDQADRYLERGRLLFFLGEIQLATEDFEYAAELAPDYIKAYAEPMLQLVSHGYYREARSLFHRAMSRPEVADSLKLYFCLWLNDLALRQGRTPDAEAEGFLADYDGDGWGHKLASYARGKLPYDDLLAAAHDDGERAEAFFYEGLRRWRSGDPQQGKALLQRVVDTNLMGFFEYDMAQAYLAWDELPAAERSPNPSGTKRRQ